MFDSFVLFSLIKIYMKHVQLLVHPFVKQVHGFHPIVTNYNEAKFEEKLNKK